MFYDRAGYGYSEVQEGRTVPDGANDAKATLDAMGITRPVAVIGTSGGGPYALEFAGLYPESVRSVDVLGGNAPPHDLGKAGVLTTTAGNQVIYNADDDEAAQLIAELAAGIREKTKEDNQPEHLIRQ